MKHHPLASRPEADPLRQTPTQSPQLHPLENEPVALSGKQGAWPGVTAGYMASTQQWRGEWTADDMIGSSSACEGDSTDQTGSPCPKLAEERARRALAERQFIEFNHRLANMLQMLVARIERQWRFRDDPTKGDGLEHLVASVKASARLHRCLLPPRSQAHIDLSSLLDDLTVAIEGVTGLLCYVKAEPIKLPGQVAVHLAAAVNELAWNAHKHAYGGTRGGVIRIVCLRDANARLQLSVADYGRGLPADFDPRGGDGLGLMLICAAVQQFGGELRVESDRGARFTLLLDIPRVEGDMS